MNLIEWPPDARLAPLFGTTAVLPVEKKKKSEILNKKTEKITTAPWSLEVERYTLIVLNAPCMAYTTTYTLKTRHKQLHTHLVIARKIGERRERYLYHMTGDQYNQKRRCMERSCNGLFIVGFLSRDPCQHATFHGETKIS